MQQVKAQFPDTLQFLFSPCRYKVAHGGRGGAKSWGFARALLILGANKPLRVLCARELQNSISESVHQLLAQQIQALGLSSFYVVQNSSISGANGTEFLYSGVKNNVNKIKSMEGIDVCWLEEAELVSELSWQTIIPTIRKSGSEIWVSFNPRYKSDATSQMFIEKPRPDAKIVKIGWQQNPWFPQELEKERLHAQATMSESDYLHIWEGQYKALLLGKWVYPPTEFARDRHVVVGSLMPESATEIICGWDNTGLSPAIILTYMTSTGQWVVFKEFCFEDTGIMDAVEGLVRWCNASLPQGCRYRHIGDPAGRIRDTTKQSPADYITRRAGELGWSISIEDGIQTFKVRREAVASRLTRLVNGQPAILMSSEGCPRLVEGFEGGYAYPEIGTTGIFREEPMKNHFSHIHDALQYPATRLFALQSANTDDERFCYPEAA